MDKIREEKKWKREEVKKGEGCDFIIEPKIRLIISAISRSKSRDYDDTHSDNPKMVSKSKESYIRDIRREVRS